MQTVDLVIAGVGVVAVIATTLGVVFYEDANDGGELMLETVTDEGALSHTFTGVRSGTHEHDFMVRDNATAAGFELVFQFTGQSGQGSAVTFTAQLQDPTGNFTTPPVSATRNIGPNTAGGSTSLTIPTHNWYAVPEDGHTHMWDQPLKLIITISNANDPLSGVPAVNYQFNVQATGDLSYYQAATAEVPEPSTA